MRKMTVHSVSQPAVFVVVIVAMALINVRCDGNGIDPQDDPPLRLVWLQDQDAGGDPSFDHSRPIDGSIHLGGVGHTRDFRFIVLNEGDKPLNDVRIQIQTPSEGIDVYPKSIGTLLPAERALSRTFFRLSVQHGTTFESGEPGPALPPGDVTVPLSIAYCRLESGCDTPERLEVQAAFRVHLTDFAFEDDEGSVDLSNQSGRASYGGFEVRDAIPYYAKKGSVRAVNVGTLETEIHYIARGVRRVFQVAPGDTAVVIEDNGTGWIRISPRRATLDYTRFERSSNGYTYVYFSRN